MSSFSEGAAVVAAFIVIVIVIITTNITVFIVSIITNSIYSVFSVNRVIPTVQPVVLAQEQVASAQSASVAPVAVSVLDTQLSFVEENGGTQNMATVLRIQATNNPLSTSNSSEQDTVAAEEKRSVKFFYLCLRFGSDGELNSLW